MLRSDLVYPELSYNVVGAAMEVHKQLGHGFLESVYEKALAVEFGLRKIGFELQRSLPVKYKNVIVGSFVADVVVEDKIILELKAVRKLEAVHTAQAVNYLAATGFKLAIIINFGEPSLVTARVLRPMTA